MDSTPAAVNATMRALAALYGKAHVNRALDDVNLVRVPSDDYEKISQAGDSAATAYGEITPAGVIDILKQLQAKQGSKFYDLGSGAGKAVATAWMQGLDASGIELAKVRYAAACQAISQIEASAVNTTSDNPLQAVTGGPRMRFLRGSFGDIDFSEADIVFCNSVFYPLQLMEKVAAIARGMKRGSYFVSTKVLPGPGFKQVGTIDERTTWNHGDATSYIIQEKVTDPDTSSLPQGEAEESCEM